MIFKKNWKIRNDRVGGGSNKHKKGVVFAKRAKWVVSTAKLNTMQLRLTCTSLQSSELWGCGFLKENTRLHPTLHLAACSLFDLAFSVASISQTCLLLGMIPSQLGYPFPSLSWGDCELSISFHRIQDWMDVKNIFEGLLKMRKK